MAYLTAIKRLISLPSSHSCGSLTQRLAKSSWIAEICGIWQRQPSTTVKTIKSSLFLKLLLNSTVFKGVLVQYFLFGKHVFCEKLALMWCIGLLGGRAGWAGSDSSDVFEGDSKQHIYRPSKLWKSSGYHDTWLIIALDLRWLWNIHMGNVAVGTGDKTATKEALCNSVSWY